MRATRPSLVVCSATDRAVQPGRPRDAIKTRIAHSFILYARPRHCAHTIVSSRPGANPRRIALTGDRREPILTSVDTMRLRFDAARHRSRRPSGRSAMKRLASAAIVTAALLATPALAQPRKVVPEKSKVTLAVGGRTAMVYLALTIA